MTTTPYSPLSKTLHWLTFIALTASYGIVLSEDMTSRELHRLLMGIHIQIGCFVALFVPLRLFLARQRKRPPENGWQERLARLAHFGIYGLILLQVWLGLSMVFAKGRSVALLGQLEIPAWLAKAPDLAELFEELHGLVGWLLFLVILGHIAAAFWHHRIRRDDVLRNMLP